MIDGSSILLKMLTFLYVLFWSATYLFLPFKYLILETPYLDDMPENPY